MSKTGDLTRYILLNSNTETMNTDRETKMKPPTKGPSKTTPYPGADEADHSSRSNMFWGCNDYGSGH